MNPEVQTPAIILDAHVNSFDILFTARYLRKQYPEVPILMPIAGYLLHVPGVSKWVKYWSNKYAITPSHLSIERRKFHRTNQYHWHSSQVFIQRF